MIFSSCHITQLFLKGFFEYIFFDFIQQLKVRRGSKQIVLYAARIELQALRLCGLNL